MPAIEDPQRRELAQRVELTVDAQCDAVYPQRFGTRLELELASGERRQGCTLDPHGTAADPMADAELEQKFVRLAAHAPYRVDAAAIAACVQQLERARDVRALARLLRPAACAPVDC